MRALPILLAAALASAQELSIHNQQLHVRYDPAANSFSVATSASAKPFIVDGALRDRGGSAKTAAASDPIFGNGQMIDVSYANGSSDRILLFPKLPFVLFRSTLHNRTTAVEVTSKTRPMSFTIGLAGPLKILGTGGLTDP